jgi:hypothetical protein
MPSASHIVTPPELGSGDERLAVAAGQRAREVRLKEPGAGFRRRSTRGEDGGGASRVIRSVHPNGGSRCDAWQPMLGSMNSVLLELALIVLSVVCFWLLDRYVIGCERV